MFTLAQIRKVREDLPRHTRDAILAARDSGESWQSIAQQLGMSITGVRLVSGVAKQYKPRHPIPPEMRISPSGLPYCVYRFYSKDGDLLYVGATRDFASRLGAHASKPWWNTVDHTRTRTEWHPDAASTNSAEAAAIAAEHPLHNQRVPGKSPTVYNPPLKGPP